MQHLCVKREVQKLVLRKHRYLNMCLIAVLVVLAVWIWIYVGGGQNIDGQCMYTYSSSKIPAGCSPRLLWSLCTATNVDNCLSDRCSDNNIKNSCSIKPTALAYHGHCKRAMLGKPGPQLSQCYQRECPFWRIKGVSVCHQAAEPKQPEQHQYWEDGKNKTSVAKGGKNTLWNVNEFCSVRGALTQ